MPTAPWSQLGRAEWDATSPQAAGNIVFHNGGWWQCETANTNSEPISGNADWTLVGGMPYIELVLTGSAVGNAGTFVELVPGQPSFLVVPRLIVMSFTPDSGAGLLTGAGNFSVSYDQFGTNNSIELGPGANTALSAAMLEAAEPQVGFFTVAGPQFSGDWWTTATPIGSAVFLHESLFPQWPAAAGGIPVALIFNLSTLGGNYVGQVLELDLVGQPRQAGDPTIRVDAVDNIGRITAFTVLSFGSVSFSQNDILSGMDDTPLAITGVNQGTQTFTVAGDQTAKFPVSTLSTTFLVDSGANAGSYTTVSATLNAGSTDVVTAEAIPSPIVAGNIYPGSDNADFIALTDAGDQTLMVKTFYEMIPVS